jgi:ABC transport system ATP-binding/permease protein
MLEPADVLMLDEPTNDLDIPTLEILEENLLEFPGALVLVTHDRYLLNRVASTVLGLDGNGQIGRFADYGQWEQWLEEQAQGANNQASAAGEQKGIPEKEIQKTSKKKLSYLEAREFAAIEQRVEASDARLAAARDRVDDPAIASDAAELQAALQELGSAQEENDALYARWAELTDKAV